MAALIEACGLGRRFGPIAAVDDLSFSVERGEVLGFLGPNGAGKSTTMRLLTGFLPASAGRARICGFDVSADPVASKRRIGYLPEGAPLYSDMTPAQLLAFVARVRGLSRADTRRRTDETVARLGLAAVLRQRIETLSKGFKRRVGLAQAILHDPPVLILDEPTDGLDPNQKHEVRTLIQAMAPEKAIIVSTHILEEVDAVCTRAAIIAKGRLVIDTTPGALRARAPRHRAVVLRLAAGDLAPVRAALGGLPGVAGIEEEAAEGDRAELVVLPEADRDIAETVAQAVREGGTRIEEMHIEQGRLDDVFRALTTPGSGTGV